MKSKVTNGVMLNAYPDSMGGRLRDIITVLNKDEFEQVFDSFYILPSVFNTDLDRGFSIIDYNLNKCYANNEDIEQLKTKGISLKFDFVLNHLSVLSPQFQDLIEQGQSSIYKDFFIDWNDFWKGSGKLEDGVLKPDDQYIKDMFFRKPSLPILMVKHPDGKKTPYWNTFYQEIKYAPFNEQELMKALNLQYLQACRLRDLLNQMIESKEDLETVDYSEYVSDRKKLFDFMESKKQYLGQMDLNIQSDLVWDFYDDTLSKLSEYGASIVRLDAFAYSSKQVGKRNFFNLPETWEDLNRVKTLADKYQLELLPEIHSTYEEKLHEEISQRGFLTYDFFLPGLIIDAFERATNEKLIHWIKDIQSKNLKVVNMLGCHDGIPLLDLKGLLAEDQIKDLIDTVVGRGGYVKELHGKKNMYYQVNATYYSALGQDDDKMILARAIQMFMPGKPQVWYLDVFAGTNDYEAVKRGGAGSHKEINRTNLSLDDIENRLDTNLVKDQLDLLRFRNTNQAFGFDSHLTIHESDDHILDLEWANDGHKTRLVANLKDYSFKIQK